MKQLEVRFLLYTQMNMCKLENINLFHLDFQGYKYKDKENKQYTVLLSVNQMPL